MKAGSGTRLEHDLRHNIVWNVRHDSGCLAVISINVDNGGHHRWKRGSSRVKVLILLRNHVIDSESCELRIVSQTQQTDRGCVVMKEEDEGTEFVSHLA